MYGTTRGASTSTASADMAWPVSGTANPAVVEAISASGRDPDHAARPHSTTMSALSPAGQAGRLWHLRAWSKRISGQLGGRSGRSGAQVRAPEPPCRTGVRGRDARISRPDHGSPLGDVGAQLSANRSSRSIPGVQHVPYNNLDGDARGGRRRDRRPSSSRSCRERVA
jgi:hypothetical protein